MGMKQVSEPTALGLELCQLVTVDTNKWDELEILLAGYMEKNRENQGQNTCLCKAECKKRKQIERKMGLEVTGLSHARM